VINPNIKKFILLILFSAFCLQIFYYSFVIDPCDHYGFSSILINYESGFTRRGLTGEIYRFLSLVPHNPKIFLTFLTSILYIILIIIFYNKFYTKLNFIFLFSPFLLGFPLLSTTILRTDIFLIIVFWLYVKLSIKFLNNTKKKFFIYFLNLVGLLIHEVFFFMIFVFNFLLYFNVSKNFLILLINSVYRNIFNIIFLLIMYFYNLKIGINLDYSIIVNKWNELWSFNNIGFRCSSLEVLKYYNMNVIDMRNLLINNNNFYIFFSWILIFIFGFISCINTCRYNKTEKINLSIILLLQSFSFLPLFLLAWDYGRWLFYIFFSSLIIFDSLRHMLKLEIYLSKISFLKELINIKYNNILAFLILFIGVPACCMTISSFFGSSIFGYLIHKFFLYFDYDFIRNFFQIF
jgi:hypothetical protein